MKKQIIGLVLVLLVMCSCTKEEIKTYKLYVSVNFSYDYVSKLDTFPITNADVYLYKDISFGEDYLNGITYENMGSGVLKNSKTGVLIQPINTLLSKISFCYFDNLSAGTYAVVADISKFDTKKLLNKSESWAGQSIRIPENMPNYKYNDETYFVFKLSDNPSNFGF
jgi:hypothetical protein